MSATYADMANLTDADRRQRMRRFEALVELDRRVRRNPQILALPPRVRQAEPEPQPRS